MRRVWKTFAAGLALAAWVAVVAPAAGQMGARRDVPAGLDATARSANFLAHYTTAGPNATDAASVQTMLEAAEFGLDRLTRLRGFQPPKPDDDGLVDIYVHDQLDSNAVAVANADDDRAGVASSGYLEVRSQERDRGTLVHELAHVMQFGYGMGTDHDWLIEGTATWASTTLYGADTTDADFVTPISAGLRCDGDCPGDGPYGVWRFWQSLTETFGPRFVGDLLRREGLLIRGSGGDPSLRAVRGALAARGTTLPRALQAYVERSARANWRHPELRTIESITSREALPGEEQTTSVGAGRQATLRTTLRPLAGRYLRITDAVQRCTPGRLRVTLQLPARVQTRPSALVSVGRGERLVRMTRAGRDWTTSFAWTRCRSDAYVLVSNGDAARAAAVRLQAVWTPR